MRVSVVIPNYNGERLLVRNIPKVISVLNEYAKRHKARVQLVITDDGSKDKSVEILNKYKEKKSEGSVDLTIGVKAKNTGFSGNVNFGASLADGDIIVLLNTDVIPEVGFLDPLIKRFDDPLVFAVGCMDRSVEEDNAIVLRGRGVGEWKRGFLQHSKGNLDRDDTLWVSGGSGAFRREVWVKIGGLSEIMNPFYWEDVDLSYRAWKSGYKMVFEKESIVVHEHEEGAIKKTSTPERVRVTALRNQFYFVWLNITDTSLIFSHLLWLPIHLLRAFFRRDWIFLKGFFFAVLRLDQALDLRSRNKKLFKVKDATILDRLNA